MVVTSCISVQYVWKYGFAKYSDNLYASCVFHGTGNSAQLFQNFGISGAPFGGVKPSNRPRYATFSDQQEKLKRRNKNKGRIRSKVVVVRHNITRFSVAVLWKQHCCFGSTTTGVTRLLYQLAEGNGVNVEFCKANEKSSARNCYCDLQNYFHSIVASFTDFFKTYQHW
jgi:hypothetical protein